MFRAGVGVSRTASLLRSQAARTTITRGTLSAAEAAAAYGEEKQTVEEAWKMSCYYNMDYTIKQDATVYEAIQRLAAYNVGCLLVTSPDDDKKLTGVFSERDYCCKVALHGRNSKETLVSDCWTPVSKLVSVDEKDTVDVCVEKMLSADIRHLPVLDSTSGKIYGLLSIKDLVKVYTSEKDALMAKVFGAAI